MVKINVEGQSIELDPRFEQLTTYFQDIEEFEGKKDEYELPHFSKANIEKVLEALKIVDYKFNTVAVVNSNDTRAYIGEPLTAFFKKIEFKQLNEIFRVASQLKLKGLENYIASYIASIVRFNLNLNDYNNKRQELGVKHELTAQKSKELKEKYAFLN